MRSEKKYTSFWSFYPYYLTEHADLKNRALHLMGTAGVIILFVAAIILKKWLLLALIPLCGYGFAWIGHYFIENNKPATFTYPLYSLGSDFVMFWHIITGRINKKITEANNIINKQS